MTTWRRSLLYWLDRNNETFDDLVSCTLTETDLDFEFNKHGGPYEGEAFYAWTKDFVYFSKEGECHECTDIGYVPRNPCDAKPWCIR